MSLWNIKEINAALEIQNSIDKNLSFKRISIDSRTVKKGDLFIPIKGSKFNGHDFIKHAFEKGANASIVEQNEKKRFLTNKKIILVKDSNQAFKKLALYSRMRNKNLILIGITGSSGKTTLKEWSHQIFKKFKRSYCTFGNYNNEIGLPLTLVNMPKQTELCILELGMNSKGEIKKLSKIAKPTIAVITNIGTAHSGNFLKLNDIAQEKSQILSYLDKDSIAMIPRDSEYFEFLLKKANKKTKRVYSFGESNECDIQISKTLKKHHWIIKLFGKKIEVKNKIYFESWSQHTGIILGLAKLLKFNLDSCIKTSQTLSPINGRGKIIKKIIQGKKIVIIDDSYNSNPESLSHAIKNLKNYYLPQSRKICVIGDMLELGNSSKEMHIAITKIIMKNKPDVTITLGKLAKLIFDNLPNNFEKYHYDVYHQVWNKLTKIIKDKDVVMLKGSNSTNLHIVSNNLINLS